ncbi:autotransporter assembly complex protein TamA [Aliidiomarina indica]|uniref:autotransporter assembly complex protein TamA n=1 Tax=Aliidiomarina indica TaxID=2749147 RepID=UPI00188FB1CC|nr:autotransporter assembly complex family protein [Aliidiomarina indica]
MRYLASLLVLSILFLAPSVGVANNASNGNVYVSIEGVDGRVANNVRSLLSIYALHEQSAPGAARVRYLHELAHRDIRRAVTPYGYYQFELESSLEQRDNNWYAHYEIRLGSAIPIGTVSIEIQGEAQEDEAFRNIRNRVNLRSGSALRHSQYESAKNRIRDLAAERGYYQARFVKQELRIDLDSYLAHVELVLDSGPRYRYGRVTFNEGHLDEDLLYRFVTFEQGQPVSSNEIIALQQGMAGTDYFGRVEVQPLWAEADDDYQVPIAVNFEPNKRRYYRTGIGYGTDTGPRIRFDVNQRWVNSRGHRVNGQIQLSEILNSVGASYIIPGARPQTDQYAIRALYRDEDTSSTQSELFSVGVSWQTELTRTQRVIALDWQTERDVLDGVSRRSDFLLPSASWTRVHADNRLDVDRGFRLNFTVRGASTDLLSDTDFLQSTLSGKFVTRLSERVRILSRSEIGLTASGNFDRVPTSLRFYAGGDNSVRGYGYRSIGPRTELGDARGARHLFTGSIEADYEFRTNWRFAVFTDVGNAFDELDDPIKVGAGFGLRWQSPVGPIRIDLAHGFSEPGDTVRLHLTIGPDL